MYAVLAFPTGFNSMSLHADPADLMSVGELTKVIAIINHDIIIIITTTFGSQIYRFF
jgi:hypothetical protein